MDKCKGAENCKRCSASKDISHVLLFLSELVKNVTFSAVTAPATGAWMADSRQLSANPSGEFLPSSLESGRSLKKMLSLLKKG